MPNTAVYFYCETSLQLRIATAIAKQLPSEISATLLLGEWTSGKNVLSPPKALHIDAITFDIESGGAAMGPKERWQRISTTVKQTVENDSLFVLFQDQHFHAQAAVAGARAKGASIILIQDGHLDFDMSVIPRFRRAFWPLLRKLDPKGPQHPRPRLRQWLYQYFYKQHFFGHVRPDHTFVFGESLAERLVEQFGLRRKSVHPVGVPLQTPPPKTEARPLRKKNKISILFLDQCFLRYQRISEKGWREEYLPLIGALAPYSPTIKFHPAQTEHAESEIREQLDNALYLPRRALQSDDLDGTDLAVTATSSSFLECIAAGVPVIFVTLPSSLDRMPTIKSPLIRNVSSLEELTAAIEQRHDTGQFANNKDGKPLERFIYSYNAAPVIADFLKKLAAKRDGH